MNVTALRSDDGFVYVQCPQEKCGTGLRVNPKSAKTNVNCANCGNKFTLQVWGPPPIPSKNVQAERKATPPERPAPKPIQSDAPWDSGNEGGIDPRLIHGAGRKNSGSFPVGLIVCGGIVALLVAGGAVAGGLYLLKKNDPAEPIIVAEAKEPQDVEPDEPEKNPDDSPKPERPVRPRPKKNDPVSPKPPIRKKTETDPPEIKPVKGTESEDPKVSSDKDRTKEILARVKRSTGLIEAKGGWGTGFVIRPGIVMTNAHVISGRMLDDFRMSFVSLTQTAPPPLPVTLLYMDKRRDLAILRVDTDVPPLEMTSPKTNLSGMEVAVVGNPKGDAGQAEINKVTTGTLSAPIRRDAGWTYFELRAQAYFGNSGGPVVDLKTGKLVGVMQSILGDGRSKSYCIPFSEAQLALDTLPKETSQEISAVRTATARHYLDMIAVRLPEIERNAEFAMQAQLANLLNGGRDVAITVTTDEGKIVRMTLAELMVELKEKHADNFANTKKAIPWVSASSEIPSALKQLARERVDTCSSMLSLANSRTNYESSFRRAMNARKSANEAKAKAFSIAYEKFLDDLERRPLEK